MQLNVELQPGDASIKDVVWTSSDDSVVSVNEEGVLTRIKEGQATITIAASDGSGTAASVIVEDDNLQRLFMPEDLSIVSEEAYANNVSVQCVDFSRIKGSTTVSIMEKAFKGCTGLAKVVIKDGVRIAPDAFEGCPDLVLYGAGEETAQLAEELGVKYVRLVLE